MSDGKVIHLADHRAPVRYVVDILHYWDGKLMVRVHEAGSDERSRKSIADTLREVADAIENTDLPVEPLNDR